ncbi:MAG TPA: ATP-binding protein, partial [Chitinophagaceae bacterium]
MSLPVNIEQILNGQTVEWERIECKQGWNPEDVIHTIGAFANDINNWGGGYIFIAVAEKDGIPQLPPVGLHAGALDSIQKELLSLSHKIQPYYAPVYQPYVFNDKHILVIWIPGGDNRPYKVPSTLGAKGQHRYYVRRGSSSVIA